MGLIRAMSQLDLIWNLAVRSRVSILLGLVTVTRHFSNSDSSPLFIKPTCSQAFFLLFFFLLQVRLLPHRRPGLSLSLVLLRGQRLQPFHDRV